jgi:hypothetical protein
MIRTFLRRFLRDDGGNFAITFGLVILPVMFLTGLAMDYTLIQRERWRLQETADSSAFYAVKELEKAGYTERQLKVEAKNVVASNFTLDGAVEVELNTSTNRLIVELAKQYEPTFLKLMHPGPVDIGVLAEVAYSQVYEGAKCFMALSETGKGVLNLNGNAVVDARNCGVHVNSESDDAVDLNGNGTEINSASNCFVGGIQSGGARIFPPPEESCYILPDPFEDHDIPSYNENCTYSDVKVNANKTVTLLPGVYCGGISIGSGAKVTFSSGLYVIKDGEFKTTGDATLTGNGVGFFFTGTGVALNFSGSTTFQLVAMNTVQAQSAGAPELAGFIVFFDPLADMSQTSSFSGNSNTYFEGVLYFGRRDITINGEGEINTGSPFASVVANTITLNGNGLIYLQVKEGYNDLPIPDELYEKIVTPYLVR